VQAPQPMNVRERAQELRIQVAVDGPAGAGKSTIGEAIARQLDIPVLDTGLMYREVTRAVLEDGLDLADGDILAGRARQVEFDLKEKSHLFADGRILAAAGLHHTEIDRRVSQVAAHPSVRRVLVEAQRRIAGAGPIVMLGRDIGTVVLPSADVKLFVTATPEARAERRRRQRQLEASPEPAQADFLVDIQARDAEDSNRLASPLKQATDAIIIVTTDRSVEESVEAAYGAVIDRLAKG